MAVSLSIVVVSEKAVSLSIVCHEPTETAPHGARAELVEVPLTARPKEEPVVEESLAAPPLRLL